jgi:hypothetical protein
MREKGHKYGILVGKTVGKRPLGKTWHKCRDNIKMGHKEIQCEYVEYTHVAPDKDQWWTSVIAVVPLNAREFFSHANFTFLRTESELGS